jgi:hypothetical protein
MKGKILHSMKPRAKKPLAGEAGVQTIIVNYLKFQYPGILYCASAGGMFTSMKQAIKMKMTGYVKGFPDLQICEPNEKYHGLFIEVKTEKGVVSKEQKEWIKQLNKRGYYATYVKGSEDAIKLIDAYFSNAI